jgi:hypothetical protein
MMKRVIFAGLMGALVMIVWTLVINGFLGFRANIDMKTLSAEREVYEILKQRVVEPGRYAVNPEVSAERGFPDEEPVFSILYSGMGHEAAGSMMLVGLLVFILSPMIGAWMLSQASDRVLASYCRKVMFFVAIGLLFAIYSHLTSFGIGGYPFGDAIALAANDIVVWLLVGLVVAWRLKPVRNATV